MTNDNLTSAREAFGASLAGMAGPPERFASFSGALAGLVPAAEPTPEKIDPSTLTDAQLYGHALAGDTAAADHLARRQAVAAETERKKTEAAEAARQAERDARARHEAGLAAAAAAAAAKAEEREATSQAILLDAIGQSERVERAFQDVQDSADRDFRTHNIRLDSATTRGGWAPIETVGDILL